jgi:hypothetical protein
MKKSTVGLFLHYGDLSDSTTLRQFSAMFARELSSRAKPCGLSFEIPDQHARRRMATLVAAEIARAPVGEILSCFERKFLKRICFAETETPAAPTSQRLCQNLQRNWHGFMTIAWTVCLQWYSSNHRRHAAAKIS